MLFDYVMLCYVMLCYVMLCYVMLCYVMLCYVMLCYVMLCYVMLCYVMLFDFVNNLPSNTPSLIRSPSGVSKMKEAPGGLIEMFW